MTMNRRQLLGYGAALPALGLMGMPARLQAQTRQVPFSLDFRIYGGNGPYLHGAASGIFEDLGLDVAIEGASGSAESIRRVATGSHLFGYADIMTLIEFTGANPNEAPKLIMPILDRSPASIMTIGGEPPTSLADLRGKRIAVAANSAATKILPGMLRINQVAEDDIEFVAVDVRIRDTMLLQGEVDGVVGFDYTSVFNFVESGIAREDVNVLYFAESGFDFPANSLIASQRMIAEEPELCAAVALAVARSWRAAVEDVEATVASTVEREPLLRHAVEVERLQYILDTHVGTDSVRQNGLGLIAPERADATLGLMAEAFEMERRLELEDFFVDSFLPPQDERMIFG